MNINHPGRLAFFALVLFIGAYAAGYYGHLPEKTAVPIYEPRVEPDPKDFSSQNPTPAPTPIPPTASGTATPPAQNNGVLIDTLALIEDSRCPITAKCIWAGTVKVKVQVSSGMMRDEVVLELDKPSLVLGKTITLTDVQPPKQNGDMPFSSYRFTYDVR